MDDVQKQNIVIEIDDSQLSAFEKNATGTFDRIGRSAAGNSPAIIALIKSVEAANKIGGGGSSIAARTMEVAELKRQTDSHGSSAAALVAMYGNHIRQLKDVNSATVTYRETVRGASSDLLTAAKAHDIRTASVRAASMRPQANACGNEQHEPESDGDGTLQ